MKKYKISDVANLFGVTRQTLIHYDKIGLFKPLIIDKETSYRYYTEEQFLDLAFIIGLKSADFSLNEILEYFESKNSIESFKYLQKKLDAVDEKIVNLKKAKKLIKNKKDEISLMMFDGIEKPMIEEIQEKRGVAVEILLPKDDYAVFSADVKLKNILKENNIDSSPRILVESSDDIINGIYYQGNILAAETNKGDTLIIEKGLYATMYHKENDIELSDSCEKLKTYLTSIGYKIIEKKSVYYEASVTNRGIWKGILIKIYMPIQKVLKI
ncbi:MAG: MerR family transcriptional regulator [Fusobacteriaceae bacterium]